MTTSISGSRLNRSTCNVCVLEADGISVFDACPSTEAFAEFSQSAEFRTALADAGLPQPRLEPLGEVTASACVTGHRAVTTTSPATEMAALDAVAQAELVRRGEVTPAELVGWAIERIEDLNPVLNAVITPMYDNALAAAAATPSTVAGRVPYLVKDLIAEVAGVPASEGSRFLRDNVSRFDSELVLRLRRAGLVIVGKPAPGVRDGADM